MTVDKRGAQNDLPPSAVVSRLATGFQASETLYVATRIAAADLALRRIVPTAAIVSLIETEPV